MEAQTSPLKIAQASASELLPSLRNRTPYIDPLNYIQVEMIRRLRALTDKNTLEAEALRDVIELTINGVSGGLKNTG